MISSFCWHTLIIFILPQVSHCLRVNRVNLHRKIAGIFVPLLLTSSHPVLAVQDISASATPFKSLSERVFDDASIIFDSEFSSALFAKFPIDIVETPKSYEIIAELAGVRKEDAKIELKERVLTISANKKKNIFSESETMRRSERFDGFVSRSVRLPDDADENRIEAKYENGELKIIIAKIVGNIKYGSKVINIK